MPGAAGGPGGIRDAPATSGLGISRGQGLLALVGQGTVPGTSTTFLPPNPRQQWTADGAWPEGVCADWPWGRGYSGEAEVVVWAVVGRDGHGEEWTDVSRTWEVVNRIFC